MRQLLVYRKMLVVGISKGDRFFFYFTYVVFDNGEIREKWEGG